jgi:integrase
LYPAAVAAGVLSQKTIKCIERDKTTGFDRKGKQVKRFGFHQFRHSLSSYLTTKAKIDPKTAQTALRHSNVNTTLNLYTQTDSDELQTAQSMMLDAIFSAENGHVQ